MANESGTVQWPFLVLLNTASQINLSLAIANHATTWSTQLDFTDTLHALMGIREVCVCGRNL